MCPDSLLRMASHELWDLWETQVQDWSLYREDRDDDEAEDDED